MQEKNEETLKVIDNLEEVSNETLEELSTGKGSEEDE